MKIRNIIFTIILYLLHPYVKSYAVPQETKNTPAGLSHQFTNRFLQHGYCQTDIDNFVTYVKNGGITSALQPG
jgi:hypothetical protein